MKNKVLIKHCIDLVDLVDLSGEAVDSIRSATHVPYYPEIPPSTKNKTIIVNQWYEGKMMLLDKLKKHNTILNRLDKYGPSVKYNIHEYVQYEDGSDELTALLIDNVLLINKSPECLN